MSEHQTEGAPSTGTPLRSSRLPSSPITTDSSWAQEDVATFGEASPKVAPVIPDVKPGIQYNTETRTRVSIDALLTRMVEINGSDLYLTNASNPRIRVHGEVTPMVDFPVMSGAHIRETITAIMTTEQIRKFDEDLELDFAYDLEGQARFRVNVMKQKGDVAVVMRTIPWDIKTVEELGLPPVVSEWAMLPRGLVLITGPTGSGKSTTLASIIDYANRQRESHIVTIEDPIEFIHEHRRSIVNQREVGSDTKSFTNALRHVLRQAPDIILIGELRDLETISIALTAAETGHLVFGTLHTQSAPETISRIIDVFPGEQQAQVRTQLASTIQGIASQTLLKTYDDSGRVAAVEILVARDNVRANIREGKISAITSLMQTGKKFGMQTLDSVLQELVESGRIHWKTALEKASDREALIKELTAGQARSGMDQRSVEALLENVDKRIQYKIRNGI